MKRLLSIILILGSPLLILSQKDSLSLIFFLLDDCPICIDYSKTINELHTEFGAEITFVGYFPNFTSKPEKIEKYKELYHVKYPLLTDYYKTQAKKWNATVTPEVIFYNHTTKTILYRGRIDNKFVRLGRRRNIVTQHDLRDAITNFKSGNPINPASTKPVGCFITFKDGLSRDR